MVDRFVKALVFGSFILFMLCLAAPALAATWYVGTVNAADDEAHGETSAAPFATLAYAVDTADPGDTISVLGHTVDEPTVTVDKDNLTIQGDDADPDRWRRFAPADPATPALIVAAYGVTLRYLTFHGSTSADGALGVYDPVAGAKVYNTTIDNCRFGLDGETTAVGLNLSNTGSATVTDCKAEDCGTGLAASSASLLAIDGLQAAGCTAYGLHLAGSVILVTGGSLDAATGVNCLIDGTDVRVSGLTATGGETGILVKDFTNILSLAGCTVSNASGAGVSIEWASDVCLSGNVLENNGTGLALNEYQRLIVAGNRLSGNLAGLTVAGGDLQEQLFVFANTFGGNNADLESAAANVTLVSPAKLHLTGPERQAKAYAGNHYAGWGGAVDANGDGLCDAARVESGGNISDPAPLMQPLDAPGNDNLDFFGADDTPLALLHIPGAMSPDPGRVQLAVDAGKVFVAYPDSGAGRSYRGGPAGSLDGFSGWLAFYSDLSASGHVLVEIGTTASDGTGFAASGQSCQIVGDGGTKFFYYSTSGPAMRVPEDRRLALRLTNKTAGQFYVMAGGAWLGLAAPLPPVSLSQLWLNLL
jgi:nitrous oxidase accessory protein NosD